jgi:ABC-type dipeptide/oligopeptide/nickel transport system permease subunit
MSNRKFDKDMFDFVQMDKSIHDKKFDTKPIGYFKDAWIRFTKNKSSVVGGIIIIILILFAIFAPIISRFNYTNDKSPKYTETDGHYSYALPKTRLFSFLGWDGTSTKDLNQSDYDLTLAKGFEQNSNDSVESRNPIVKVKDEYENDRGDDRYVVKVDSYYNIGYEYVNLEAGDYARLQAYQEQANIQVIYPIPLYVYGSKDADLWYQLTDNATAALVVADDRNQPDTTKGIKVNAVYDEDGNFVPVYLGSSEKNANHYYSLRIDGDNGNYTMKRLQVKNQGGVYRAQKDAMGNNIYTETPNQWYCYAIPNQTGYQVRVNYYEYYKFLKTSFTYNGEGSYKAITKSATAEQFQAEISNFEFDLDSGFYPMFIFGATVDGKDIFTQLGSGARLSFILAIVVSAINLTIGAIYGAIEGYYGGATDMIMERISDILSGVPFIVVATLFKLHLADKVGPLVSLLFAFVLTGWIGMAARVRMQFYRFKNQEYILSARTLGAGDRRIMFKHIFPNAIGTIITGSILSIPSVIFSESSLSYLNIINLETSGFKSIGTMLSAASSSKFTLYPYIMFFPAIFISLLMISFNLFGNGLRDAFNPSLRGADE